MVNKVSLGDDKIILSTRKRKAPKSFPQSTCKRRFLAVDNGCGLEGYLPIEEGDMACADGNTDDISIVATEMNNESDDKSAKEKRVTEKEMGERGKNKEPVKDPTKDVEIQDKKQ